MNCKNCKYWKRETWQSWKCINRITGIIEINRGFKECEKYRKEKGEIIYEKHGDCLNDKLHRDMIDIYDGRSYYNFMEDFGCIHFEKL